MAVDRKALTDAADRMVAKGEIAKALVEYRKLLAAFPGDAILLNRVGDLCLQAGFVDEAAASFRTLAATFRKEQQDKKAIAMLKRVMKLAPGDQDCAHQLSDALVAGGASREASQVHLQLAEHLHGLGRQEESVAAFAKGVALDPSRLELRLQLAQRLAEAGQKEKAAGSYLDVAEALAVERRGDEAMAALDQAASLVDGPRLTLSRARILGIIGQPEEALATLERALAEHPGNPTLIEASAEQLIHMGRPEDGLLRLRTLRQLSDRILPLCEQALHDLAVSGNLRLALRLFRPMARDLAQKGLGPAVASTLKVAFKGYQHPVLWMLRSEVALAAEDRDEALQALRQACSLALERRSQILTNILQRKIEELEGQKKTLGDIVTEQAAQKTMMIPAFGRQQRDPAIKLQLDQLEKEADGLMQMGDAAGAITLFQQVLAKEPGRYTAIHNLVQTFLHAGQPHKAQAQCVKSAEVLCIMGRKKEARQILDVAEQHAPGSTRATRRLLGLE
ncbi:MAG TPA: tetratricopeptide repeat protein [Holophagaceae bacterium]|nr:tetratricopeptide repeat protein [Holophagaceae bacterium]